ncbi:hypothetical protein [Chryseobacterium sp. GP-SGM7]|uniref:hypothetical protein n=1 Tax=Chryseobacterium sp. GP-SGM7 TaxID=3411323 RepID=UPI003B92AAF5
MRKYSLLILAFIGNLFHSQSQSLNTGVNQPVPSVSSMATYANVPVSIQTGIPNISYPLINLPTNSKSININLGLSYHTGNITQDAWASDTGLGWSLLGSGSISREIMGDFDESFEDASNMHYVKNPFDDIYNFNIPGESGKFRVIRDIANNTFQIIKLSPYNAKIEYTRTGNTATLVFDSFTITNDEGIKFKFQNYNISTMNVFLGTTFNHGAVYSNKRYRSVFFLSTILDPDNQEIVKYTYLTDIKYPLGMGTQFSESETNKLTRIEIKDRAVVEINYDKDETHHKKNDIFSIKNIFIKTPGNTTVKKYTFDYSYTPYRTLNSFTQFDSSQNVVQTSRFSYQDIQSTDTGGGQLTAKAIRRSSLSTGGAVEYNFDLLPYFYRDTVKTVMPPEIDIANVSFDQINTTTKKYYFTIAQDKEVNIEIYAAQLSAHPWSLSFYKKTGSNYQSVTSVGPAFDPDPNYAVLQTRTLTAGEYYVSLSSPDPALTLSNAVSFRAFYYDGSPTQITVQIPENGLLRIKNIKYFNLDYASVNNFSVPVKTEEYEYTRFDNPSLSSGYFTEGGTLNGINMANPIVIYKNVKISGGNGYTKYYFKAPDDYPLTSYSFWPNYTVTREGLLDKKEVYNTSHQKVSEDNFEYTFQEYNGPEYLVAPFHGNFAVKTTWIKDEKIRSKMFYNSANTETSSEVIRNIHNSKTNLERIISSDGSVQETTYQYPLEKNNLKLIAANMTGTPLEATVIKKKNISDTGKLISKSETKYDDPNHLFPTSVAALDARTNIISTEITYNKYDSKGNLLQYTTKEGIPVAVVWGYGKTQPVAKIEGFTYDQVSAYISDIVTKSDADTDASSEQVFVNALDAFRNLPALADTQITTYVYDVLIGMKSMTPPSGVREIYQYDTAGRLDKIIDENGKTIKKYKYNYKP